MSQPPWYPSRPSGPTPPQWGGGGGQPHPGFNTGVQWQQGQQFYVSQPQQQFVPAVQYGTPLGMAQPHAHTGFQTHPQYFQPRTGVPMQQQHGYPQQAPVQFQQPVHLGYQTQFHTRAVGAVQMPFRPQGVPQAHAVPAMPQGMAVSSSAARAPDPQAQLLEQQRLAREEQRRREFEIQKRKLKVIDVSKPASSLDDLLGRNLQLGVSSDSKTTTGGTVTASQSGTVTSQVGHHHLGAVSSHDGTVMTGVEEQGSSAFVGSDAVSQPQSLASREIAVGGGVSKGGGGGVQGEGEEEWGEFGGAEVSNEEPPSTSKEVTLTEGREEEEEPASEPNTAATYEKLMSMSLSTLNDPSQTRKKKMTFKTPVLDSKSPVKKSSAPSLKARAWTADSAQFSGLFAQHTEQTEVDDFSEFQSSGATPPSSLPPSSHPLTTGQIQVPRAQFGDFQLSFPGSNPPQAQTETPWSQVSTAGVGNACTTPTSAYTQPIVVTSVSSGAILSTTGAFAPKQTFGSRGRSATLPAGVEGGTGAGFSGLDPAKFPSVYNEVHQRCVVRGEEFVNTDLLYPILSSSQLPRSVLRDLWNVANKKTPGKLTQSELFVLLGLVALAQSGSPSPSLEELRKAQGPPIPKLSALSEASPAPPPRAQEDDFGDFQAGSAAHPELTAPPHTATTILGGDAPLSQLLPTQQHAAASQSDDKYGVFNELRNQEESFTVGSLPVLQPHSPSAPQPVINSAAPVASTAAILSLGSETLSPFPAVPPKGPDTDTTGVVVTETFGDFSSALPNMVSTEQVPVAGFDAFGKFSSSSHSLNPLEAVPVSQSTGVSAAPSVSEDKGWADFTQFHTPEISQTPASSSFMAAVRPAPTVDHFTVTADSTELTATGTSTSGDAFKAKNLRSLDDLEAELLNLQLGPVPLKPSDAKTLSTKEDDSFGEFATYSPITTRKKKLVEGDLLLSVQPKGAQRNAVDVWRTCLCRCEELMSECVTVFSGVREEGIIAEITGSEEGLNKLKGIVGVYRLAKRIYCSLGSRETAPTDERVARNINSHWKTLEGKLPGNIMSQLYAQTTPSLSEHDDTDVLSDTISKCSLCLVGKWVAIPSPLSLDGKKEEYGVPLLFKNGQSYHAACANFWSHAVLGELPIVS